MSANDLVKILTEVITAGPSNIPPYRHAEITEVEEYLRNGRWHLQNVLNCQRTSIARLNTELELTALRLREATDDNIQELKTQRNQLQNKLRQACAPPTVALTILVSKLQQFRRGVTIYKVLRLRKIISVCFHHFMSQASKQTDSIGNQDLFALPSNVLEKCSEEERATIGYVLHCLKTNKVEEMFEQFPTEPTLDHGHGWLDPALWLIVLAAKNANPQGQENVPIPSSVSHVPHSIELEPWTYADILDPQEEPLEHV
eukprot:Gregarina_sp_Pseudo_9__5568@NODE_747_length_2277_cov_12_525022_g703_i0_p2_GENE_NODE_747_length_2277_cov_12_525022_g703_i0NODE_747_length_2277_cov_12_525022_g703_i0_p2_ORF_typecomplete_len258_score29_93Cys_rich_FGFR/PF00839_17/3_5e02Cys_rich_FGFR/PF00839_17/1_3_NODE_747_length_2277_cov_12_525022_g703_i03776